MKKDLDYYRSLPYSLTVDRFEEEEDGETYYRASYEELPHVKGVHEERLMAVRLAKELFDSYIEAQLEWGGEIPEPEPRFRKRGGLYKFDASDQSRSGGSSDTPSVSSNDDAVGSRTGADRRVAGAR